MWGVGGWPVCAWMNVELGGAQLPAWLRARLDLGCCGRQVTAESQKVRRGRKSARGAGTVRGEKRTGTGWSDRTASSATNLMGPKVAQSATARARLALFGVVCLARRSGAPPRCSFRLHRHHRPRPRQPRRSRPLRGPPLVLSTPSDVRRKARDRSNR